MADEEAAARRREIRRRKILEGSEARLKRITGSVSSKSSDERLLEERHEEQAAAEKEESIQRHNLDQHHSSECFENDFLTNDIFNEQFPDCDFPTTSNGNYSRSGSSDNYTFPKKVSDAESRSFRRSRGDARRNSTCTQMMMETFQFSSWSLRSLRPWIICLGAFILRIYLLIAHVIPCAETIYFLLFMLELAFFAWSQLESQMPVESSLLSGILLLYGVSERLISKVNAIWNFVNCIVVDFAIFTFLFVFTHYVCEISM